jgi:hypothetical protein
VHQFGSAAWVRGSAYWQGHDVARGIVLLPGSTRAGYVIDSSGGYHPFGGAPPVSTPDYAPGCNVHGLSIA